jgi:hypothetical protein
VSHGLLACLATCHALEICVAAAPRLPAWLHHPDRLLPALPMGYPVPRLFLYRQLPIKYVGYSTCFRKEAGSHGRDTLGIFRCEVWWGLVLALSQAVAGPGVGVHETVGFCSFGTAAGCTGSPTLAPHPCTLMAPTPHASTQLTFPLMKSCPCLTLPPALPPTSPPTDNTGCTSLKRWSSL